MDWWDHEELKSPDDRSEKYKVAFPDEYSGDKTRRIQTVSEKDTSDGMPLFIAIKENVIPEQCKVFYNKDELLSFVFNNSDRNTWKFYRISEEVKVEPMVVSVKTPKLRVTR